MTVDTTLSGALEAALNLYLKQDPASLLRCADLQGKVIALELTVPPLSFYFLPDDKGIQVLGHYEGEVHTRLTGSPFGFARLSLDSKEDALFTGAVAIQGDTETGQRFQELLADVDWDWEEQLSRITGDIVAHKLGDLGRRALQFGQETRLTLEQDAGEYLREESRLLPTRDEMQLFLEQVDVMRCDVDRLVARVERLLQQKGPAA